MVISRKDYLVFQ